MRSIFFMVFSVVRSSGFKKYHDISNPQAFLFIKDHDKSSAFIKASFYTEKMGWGIKELLFPPVIVEEKSFYDIAFHKPHLQEANEIGISIFLRGKSNSYENNIPFEMVSEKSSDPSAFFAFAKESASRKTCLHFDSGESCDSIIKAHSIQKSRSLKAIAKKGHVYGISNKVEDGGVIRFKKKGIERISTFQGFCKKHDNELFELIDNNDYTYDLKQTFLYAYRSICRELYVKQNSLELSSKMLAHVQSSGNEAERNFVESWNIGTKNGLRSLLLVKKLFDQVAQDKEYEKIEYVVLSFSDNPVVHFSGLTYPEYDFKGNRLQDLADLEAEMSLVTFCSAPIKDGWAVIFSWHVNHAKIGRAFLGSLASLCYSGGNLGDAILRLAISNCENFAIAPEWWDGLSSKTRDEIEWRFAHVGGPMSVLESDHLANGLEGIVSWNCEGVKSSF